MKILVTGGAGYIGSQAVLSLLKNGNEVIVFDNLEEGHIEALEAIKKYTNKEIILVKGDLRKKDDIADLFKKHNEIDCVIHFAAFIQVGESVQIPLKYYEDIVDGSINLFEAMLEAKVKRIVFSSTAAVYGFPEVEYIEEDTPKNTVNPYGESKKIVERILDDLFVSDGLCSVRLRYFNVSGASHTGIIGEEHRVESHLIPNVLFAAQGKQECTIFGEDYKTPDGTCIRDYVHVEDLVDAHILALDYLFKNDAVHEAFNLGSKNGYSVKEIVDICKKVTKIDFKVVIGKRRPGDPDKLVADATKARNILGWNPKYNVEDMVQTLWNWYLSHPGGY